MLLGGWQWCLLVLQQQLHRSTGGSWSCLHSRCLAAGHSIPAGSRGGCEGWLRAPAFNPVCWCRSKRLMVLGGRLWCLPGCCCGCSAPGFNPVSVLQFWGLMVLRERLWCLPGLLRYKLCSLSQAVCMWTRGIMMHIMIMMHTVILWRQLTVSLCQRHCGPAVGGMPHRWLLHVGLHYVTHCGAASSAVLLLFSLHQLVLQVQGVRVFGDTLWCACTQCQACVG